MLKSIINIVLTFLDAVLYKRISVSIHVKE